MRDATTDACHLIKYKDSWHCILHTADTRTEVHVTAIVVSHESLAVKCVFDNPPDTQVYQIL